MSKNQFTHIYVAGSFGIFVAQITQLADNDVDQDVQIVSVKEFMTIFVLEYVHDDFLSVTAAEPLIRISLDTDC